MLTHVMNKYRHLGDYFKLLKTSIFTGVKNMFVGCEVGRFSK